MRRTCQRGHFTGDRELALQANALGHGNAPEYDHAMSQAAGRDRERPWSIGFSRQSRDDERASKRGLRVSARSDREHDEYEGIETRH